MPIDPILAGLLSQMPSPEIITDPDQHRAVEKATNNALAAQFAEPAPEGADRKLVEIPVEGGTIELHIYTPPTPGPHAGYLFFFGGGFRGGSIHYDFVDIACRERCIGADTVVVSVGYRLAPEHPFPTGHNDGYAALLWVSEHAEELGIEPERLIIGGQSAGGNLASTVALRARDEQGPAIALQVLEIPSFDLTWGSARHEYDTGYILELSEIEQIKSVLFTDPADARTPYASPVFAEDLSGLPAAVILTSEYDLTRDSAETYARRLKEAGVPVTYKMAEGQIHASAALTGLLEAARTWRSDVITALRTVSAN